jgi:CHASE3 domain sensor protein
MPLIRPRLTSNFKSGAEAWATLGLAAVLTFFLLSGAIAFLNVRVLQGDNRKIEHTHTVLIAVDDLMSTMQDAETGQRGYLLTGDDKYLDPYKNAVAAVAQRIDTIATLTQDNPTQQANLVQITRHIDAKLAELNETIDLRTNKGVAAALVVVTTDRGKVEMDAIRAQAQVMRQEELRLRTLRQAEMATAYKSALASGILSALLGASLTVIVFLLIRRNSLVRARQ